MQTLNEASIQIPNKSMFKLNEVCGLTGVKPYVLRFWESEFEDISPITSSSGQKLYEHQDIEAIGYVKKLLFVDKMTIEEAKEKLNFRSGSITLDADKEEQMPHLIGESSISRSLSDSDVQKLVMAKAKLSSLLMLVDEIEQSNNWS